jgi:hypothetical protein
VSLKGLASKTNWLAVNSQSYSNCDPDPDSDSASIMSLGRRFHEYIKFSPTYIVALESVSSEEKWCDSIQCLKRERRKWDEGMKRMKERQRGMKDEDTETLFLHWIPMELFYEYAQNYEHSNWTECGSNIVVYFKALFPYVSTEYYNKSPQDNRPYFANLFRDVLVGRQEP